MLIGIDPLLSGELLLHLDQMGHSDTVAVVDAHFPAHRLGRRCVEIRGVSVPRLLTAVSSVMPIDDHSVTLMAHAENAHLPIYDELSSSLGPDIKQAFISRWDFYDLVADAYVVVRSGERRVYANAALRKGVVS